MIIRNAAVRHGRCQLAAPVARSMLLRHLTTTSTPTATQTTHAWPEAQAEQPAPPKLFSASKKKQRRDNASISLSTNTGHEHYGTKWTRSHEVGGRELSPKKQYAEFERVQRSTRSVGTRVERRYVPSELIANPPTPEDVSLELLMASQTHMGHNTSLITNRDVILRNKGMKVVDGKDKELDDFDGFKNTARPLVPDLVVCLNPMENYTLLYECGLASVPTIGVIDTNANPTWVSYTIPANDDSLRSAAVIGGVLGRAGQRGQERRLAEAKNGNVTWQTPPPLETQMQRDIKTAVQQRKEVMGRMQANLVGFNDEELQILQTEYDGAAKSVSEADMVNMMAETSIEEAAEVHSPVVDLAAKAGELAASLDTAKDHASTLESDIAEIRR
ncbi:hypothetical protein LLEC1_06638 [Akanthomyces lecanii]|uniref:Ribosomal protein S2 n=1 Tax=Cordyceps confragosa TaxID=2714763 RepID=A0A179III9_CORDF|nr:hypothetical protein LLEC1_06638 [Akanthomyces lecanii]